MDLKDGAKIQLTKTLNYLRKEELEKLTRNLKQKRKSRVESVMINREDPELRADNYH